jgi:hypothetical protein
VGNDGVNWVDVLGLSEVFTGPGAYPGRDSRVAICQRAFGQNWTNSGSTTFGNWQYGQWIEIRAVPARAVDIISIFYTNIFDFGAGVVDARFSWITYERERWRDIYISCRCVANNGQTFGEPRTVTIEHRVTDTKVGLIPRLRANGNPPIAF